MYTPNSFVQYKDLPNFTTMFGNIGKSWDNPLPNDLYIKGVPKNIKKIFATADIVGNIGAGVDDLHTFTLPGGSLKRNGDYLIADLGGSIATNDNDKRVLGLFDGSTYEDGVAAPQDLDGGGNNGWRFFNKFIRVDATHVRVHSFFATLFLHINSAGGFVLTNYMQLNRDFLLTVANLDTNDIVMKCQGEATANNDVVQDMTVIDLVRF